MLLTLNTILKKHYKIKILHHQLVEILLQNNFTTMTNS